MIYVLHEGMPDCRRSIHHFEAASNCSEGARNSQCSDTLELVVILCRRDLRANLGWSQAIIWKLANRCVSKKLLVKAGIAFLRFVLLKTLKP